jgi:hypothetical protein
MPCLQDTVKPGLRWLTIASGALLMLGGLGTCISIDPFDIFHGVFNFLFGLLILGAVFEIEKILKQVAFLKTFWGRGLLFVYLGIPLLKQFFATEWDKFSDDQAQPCDTDADSTGPISATQSAIFEAIVGASLTVNGILNLSMACSNESPGAKDKDDSSSPGGLASALMSTPAPV